MRIRSTVLQTTGPAWEAFLAFMRVYETAFHPIWYAAAAGLLVVGYEWVHSDLGEGSLSRRLGAFSVAAVVAVVPAAVYLLATPARFGPTFVNPSWQVDVANAFGILLAVGILWGVWRAYDWGDLVPGAALVLVGTLLPYAAIAPFWNISGHVSFTAAPTYYLLLVDRRFWPLLAVPALMVVNRPVLGWHTWLQSIAGLGLAAVGIGVLFASRAR